MYQVRKKPRGKGVLNKHPFSLGVYYLFNILIYSVATLVVLYWGQLFEDISFWWILSLIPLFLDRFRFIASGSIILIVITLSYYWAETSWLYLALLPISLYLGHLTTVFIHNAAHNNFKPIWLNPIIGELCALQQLSAGLPLFRLVHNEHHSHSDDPERDPHPPKGYTIWQYIDVTRSLVMKRVRTIYLEKWGDTIQNHKKWRLQNSLLLISRFVKTFFIFSLLGPKLFVFFFLPSYLSSVFLFAVINYYTHQEKEDGTIEVLNLDSNLYYQVCNKVLFGVMYHKNHHLRPKLFNPMNLVT